MAYNKVILEGRLTDFPEMKVTNTGKNVTSFCVAVNRPKNQNGDSVTDWIDCVAWGKTAELICKYFGKGKPILIEGELQTRTYEDKNGNKRKAVEVRVDEIRFTESDSKNESRPAPAQGGADFMDIEADEDEDLPF